MNTSRVCGIICSLVMSLCCWYWWVWWTSAREKIQSMVFASAFGCIEACWYRIHTGRYWTTWQQHYTLLLFSPLFFTTGETVETVETLVPPFWFHTDINIFLFPLKVWLFEIVAGYYLQLCYGGKNPAWTYHGPSAYCHGNIVVSFHFWLRWLCLGLLHTFLVLGISG